jgi:hypothetical protein
MFSLLAKVLAFHPSRSGDVCSGILNQVIGTAKLLKLGKQTIGY